MPALRHQGHVALLALIALAGCASHPAPAPVASGPAPRVYAIDLTGKAARCQPGKAAPKPGTTVEARISTDSAGGWCGLAVQRHGAPYAAGLLTRRAANGRVYIHSVGAVTRIDYTPDAGFVGTDRFAVTLLPGDAKVNVGVTARP